MKEHNKFVWINSMENYYSSWERGTKIEPLLNLLINADSFNGMMFFYLNVS